MERKLKVGDLVRLPVGTNVRTGKPIIEDAHCVSVWTKHPDGTPKTFWFEWVDDAETGELAGNEFSEDDVVGFVDL